MTEMMTVERRRDGILLSTSQRATGSRAPYVLTSIVAVTSIIASACGLLVHGLYLDDTAWAREALRGGDLVTLTLIVPALVVAMLLANRGSTRAALVWAGLLAYGVYDFAFYVFGAAFNDLFLLHVAAFSASVFGLVTLLVGLDARSIAARFDARTPRRLIAAFLVLIAIVFTTLWVALSLRFAIEGSLSLGAATLDGMHLVFALDLSLMAPGMAIAGIGLWRRSRWGPSLATALCVFGLAYQLNLAAAGIFQANASVEGVKVIDPLGVGIIVPFLAAAIAMLRSAGPSASGPAHRWEGARWMRPGFVVKAR